MKHAGNDLLWHWDPQQISAFFNGEAVMLSQQWEPLLLITPPEQGCERRSRPCFQALV